MCAAFDVVGPEALNLFANLESMGYPSLSPSAADSHDIRGAQDRDGGARGEGDDNQSLRP